MQKMSIKHIWDQQLQDEIEISKFHLIKNFENLINELQKRI